MAEKTIKRETALTGILDFFRANAVWAAGGFLLELASGGTGYAIGGAAFAAGLKGSRRMYALGGAVFGALLRGIPDALTALAALGIVLTSQLIPENSNRLAGSIIRCTTAILAIFFSRAAIASEPSHLLITFVASAVGGCFAVCIYLLAETIQLKGFDISEARDRALLAVVSGLIFMSLSGLDYSSMNFGRFIAVFATLVVTAKRGLSGAAIMGISAVFGVSAADPETGSGAASMIAGVLLSSCLSRHGKITRMIGFLFFSCAGLLIADYSGNIWRAFAEMMAAGILYVLLPVERIGSAEQDFSDRTIAMMIRERLCFAADAISGVSSGLNAAAETLERRYTTTLAQVSDDASDRACRSCSNNMICWGQKYELFRAEFNRLVKLCRCGTELTEQSISPAVAQECINKTAVIKGVQAAYERHKAAAADERRIRELRRIYTEQLASVHDILEDMGYSAGKGGGKNRTAEKRAEQALKECGLKTPSAFISHDKRGRILLEAYGSGTLRTEKDYLGSLLINALGTEMELPEVSVSGNRVRITATERTQFSAEIGAFQLCKGKNRVCGDCYESFTDPIGRLYIVLSDGMGSGSRARIDSALACSMTAKLVKSGISLGAALETVNTSLMVKSSDESFATLDICRIDLNTGECMVFKAGASTTYIKCADRLVRASLSSAPAGTGGRLTVPAQRFTVGCGDIIIMTTDGAAVDEEWLSHELSSKTDPKELSEKIARAARSTENGREDDISVIAVAVGR